MRILLVLALLAMLPVAVANADTCSDGQSIRTRVCALGQRNYHPYPNYNVPTCDSVHPPTDAQLTQIEKAFDLAPPGLQGDLCNATILVNEYNDVHAFGFWENPAYHPKAYKRTFISIPAKRFGLHFSDIQTDNLDDLGLGWATYWEQLSAGPDPFAVGLLYLMAHELAHAKWVQQPAVSCLKNSWTDAALNAAAVRRYVFLGDEIPGHVRHVPMPSEAVGPNDNALIHRSGFASILAAASPIEDYVESYAVRSLKKCANCQFYIYPQGAFNSILVNDSNNSELANKFSCVDNQLDATPHSIR